MIWPPAPLLSLFFLTVLLTDSIPATLASLVFLEIARHMPSWGPVNHPVCPGCYTPANIHIERHPPPESGGTSV